MGHFERLQMVGRVTYCLGWVSLLLGGLVHVNVGKAMFLAINVNKRNLFEISIALFVICMASQLRTLGAVDSQVLSAGKRAA